MSLLKKFYSLTLNNGFKNRLNVMEFPLSVKIYNKLILLNK